MIRRKRAKVRRADLFDSHMTDDIFLLLLRFFVSDSGSVDGESLCSIMCVSKRWYSAANSQSLWTVSGCPSTEKENPACRIRRPSPLIREIRQRPSARHLPNLIGFANIGRRSTDDGRPSYTIRERATGKLFVIDILDADDNRIIRSAASAHHLVRDNFLTDQIDDPTLCIPVGIESSNGRMVRWFEHTDSSLRIWLLSRISEQNSHSEQPVLSGQPFGLEIIKGWFRQLLETVHKIHRTNAIHGCIGSHNIYMDSSTDPPTRLLKLACPCLFPITSCFTPSTKSLKYASPELLIPLSKGLRIYPTPAADIWSIGCVMAEVFRFGVPLFGPGPNDWEDDGRMNSFSRYARTVCRLVGRPPSYSSVLRSLQYNEFPSDSTVS